MVSIFKKTKQIKAFSLIEALVAIGITVFIFFIITNIFIAHNKLFNLQSILADTETNNSLALNRMQKIIKLAGKVSASKTINLINYSTSKNTLILELPSVDSNQNIVRDAYDYAVFHLKPSDQTKLILSIEASPQSSRVSGDTLISSSVEKIIFSYNDSDFSKVTLISVYLSSSRTVLGAPQRIITSTSISLRNIP